nr:TPA_asm: m71.5 ORF [Murid betaherpesvirus 1]DBA07821.1 TPA_asm: m71.5 ORF [Murid betaherpesvirus 1]
MTLVSDGLNGVMPGVVKMILAIAIPASRSTCSSEAFSTRSTASELGRHTVGSRSTRFVARWRHGMTRQLLASSSHRCPASNFRFFEARGGRLSGRRRRRSKYVSPWCGAIRLMVCHGSGSSIGNMWM